MEIVFADFAEAGHARRARELLPQLHAAEQARYHGFRHRRRRLAWLAGRELLLAALARRLPRVEPAGLRTDEKGAVCYARGAVHLSLSHSGGVLAAALASGPVGVDLEWPRPRACSTQARCLFTRAETQYLHTLGRDEARAGFYTLWTLKEALAKAAAVSIWDALGGAEFDLRARRCRLSGQAAHTWECTHARGLQGWHVALAARRAAGPLQLECWRRTLAGAWIAEPLLEQTTLGGVEPGASSKPASRRDPHAESRCA